MIKFLHAADLHLDSPLLGLERYEGAPLAQIRGATRAAFGNMIELAIAEPVDLVLLAGDIYDGDWRDYHTGLFFSAGLARLARAGIGVVMIRGNHDAASKISRSLSLPEGVFDLDTSAPQTVMFEALGVAVHGQGYATAAQTTDLTDAYPPPVPGHLNIGLLHTCMDGRASHAPYAPTTVATLVAKGYDYWALGHVHRREVLHTDPWIVFPGNLQGRQARERGAKGCTIVSVDGSVITEVAHRAVDVMRWSEVDVDVAGASALDDVVDAVAEGLEAEARTVGDRVLGARVRVHGAVEPALARRLRADLELLEQHVRAVAQTVAEGRVWIERVELQTRAAVDLEALASRADPLGDLIRWTRSAGDDGTLATELAADLAGLTKKLPRDIADAAELPKLDDPAAVAAMLPALLDMVVPLLIGGEEEP